MNLKNVYLTLAVLGFILPYYFFLRFLNTSGFDFPLLFEQLFANDISTFFATDLIITALVFFVFVFRAAQRSRLKNWWVYVVLTLLIGPSIAFPLFLYFREDHLQEQEAF